MAKGKKDTPIPCPICGKRICDGNGKPEGDFGIELKCPGSCGYVWLSAKYIQKHLALQNKDGVS
ncbi:MAG: hypothetical protein JRD05_00635 [Deltaproteobacteria bacterium]|nr:hypothetical protein [Deltaproteobacteria bacterium]